MRLSSRPQGSAKDNGLFDEEDLALPVVGPKGKGGLRMLMARGLPGSRAPLSILAGGKGKGLLQDIRKRSGAATPNVEGAAAAAAAAAPAADAEKHVEAKPSVRSLGSAVAT